MRALEHQVEQLHSLLQAKSLAALPVEGTRNGEGGNDTTGASAATPPPQVLAYVVQLEDTVKRLHDEAAAAAATAAVMRRRLQEGAGREKKKGSGRDRGTAKSPRERKLRLDVRWGVWHGVRWRTGTSAGTDSALHALAAIVAGVTGYAPQCFVSSQTQRAVQGRAGC